MVWFAVGRILTGPAHRAWGPSATVMPRTESCGAAMRKLWLGLAAVGVVVVVATGPGAGAVVAAPARTAIGLSGQVIGIPLRAAGLVTAQKDASTACVLPDGSDVAWLHCYTPQQIRAAYEVDSVSAISVGGRTVPNYGQGQTIVLVDPYGSPTAEADLRHFHDTFFPSLAAPDFDQVFPLGNPHFDNTCSDSGLSGACAAAFWSSESSLDIEWAYAIAPLAHIILLAVTPAETLGVQGFPTLFNAISGEIDATPPGTMFSMSLGVPEQTFGGAAEEQTARFDQVFQAGLAKHDNFFAASHDYGSRGLSKQAKESGFYPNPTVWWPASSPYVVAIGGTQLQYGWTWNPSSNDPFTDTGDFNPDYWQSTSGGNSQAVWNESWLAPVIGGGGTGGGASVVYPRPSWQQDVDPGSGDHRLVPDTAWNAALNGGVVVYITAFPEFNCGNTTGCWRIIGGTSAASPQTAGLVALVNAARSSVGKAPIGFLNPLLYHGVGAADYTDVTPQHYGSAPPIFAGTDVGVSGPVNKSAGDLEDNQIWQEPQAGYATTSGYDATTGWGTPRASSFVAALAAMQ
jgi:subtilase family serine protease